MNTNLSPEERKAMEAAWLRRYEGEEDEAISLADALGSDAADEWQAGWRAAREYSKQREGKLREALEKIGHVMTHSGRMQRETL